jgi:hypothetical protein
VCIVAVVVVPSYPANGQEEVDDPDMLKICSFSLFDQDRIGKWRPRGVSTELEALIKDIIRGDGYLDPDIPQISDHPKARYGASTYYKRKPILLFRDHTVIVHITINRTFRKLARILTFFASFM